MNSIEENYKRITESIQEICIQNSRKEEDVTCMVVSKTRSIEEILTASKAGAFCFGENRVQEACEKFNNSGFPRELHIIGNLQSNKIKKAVEAADWIDTIDSVKTAAKISEYAAACNKIIHVLIEYNTSKELSKHGLLNEDSYWELLETIRNFPNISIRGLMTVGPLTDSVKAIHASFQELRELYDKTKSIYPSLPLDTLSMGMSQDYRIGIEEGSTLVRIGSAIFGARDYT